MLIKSEVIEFMRLTKHKKLSILFTPFYHRLFSKEQVTFAHEQGMFSPAKTPQ
ncbi:hypothetical protein M23134_06417 [Microscilla marina ATCC 23134]|uniref:Uncharacterized protein n=1 Tax=Microscilla marina ATCC 23134 TaxID=313606 RepID=A1ZU97_MICM2|nr:hypothetical protein M23134_06417 [Microscilla marina ATCC 23134]